MAILFAGSEVEAFEQVTGLSLVRNRTTVGSFDTTYARGALGVGQNGYLAARFAPQTDIWVHMEVYFGAMGAGSTTPSILFVDSVTGQVVAQFDGDGTTGTNNLEYWDGAAFQEITPDDTLAVNTKYRFDFRLRIDNTTGLFSYYRDGTLIHAFSGDTLNAGFTAIDTVLLSGFGTGAADTGFSQVIVATSPTIGMRLLTLAPTGNGTNTAWTGAFGDVSTLLVDNSAPGATPSYIYTTATGDKETYACTDAPAAVKTLAPIAVVVAARGRTANGATPDALRLGVRTNATDDFESPFTAEVSAELRGCQRIMPVNPVTGLDWTFTEIDALEIGVQSA